MIHEICFSIIDEDKDDQSRFPLGQYRYNHYL